MEIDEEDGAGGEIRQMVDADDLNEGVVPGIDENTIDVIVIRDDQEIGEQKVTPQNGELKPKDEVDDSDSSSESDGEGQGCPVCLEPWTNSGSHRIVSLRCGHLFGRSCIERWLKGKNTQKCPQCNCPARRKQIRNIYCKALKVFDTSERDRALQELEEEKRKRMSAEDECDRTRIHFERTKIEMIKLRMQLEQEAISQTHNAALEGPSSSQTASSQGPSSQEAYPRPSENATQHRVIHLKTIKVSQSKARVMAYDKTHAMMVASKPSPNQMFPGYGIAKVSSLELRTSEYVPVHQSCIRDICFNSSGDRLLLSASMDKTLKITSMTSSMVVLSYTCPAPVWSCQWKSTDTNYVFAGLQNGQCHVFDIRNIDEPCNIFQASYDASCPIISMVYLSDISNDGLGPKGLLTCSLNRPVFWEFRDTDGFYNRPFNVAPGPLCGLAVDEVSRKCLLSYRPSVSFPNLRYQVYSLTNIGITNPLPNRPCAQFLGSSVSKVLSRSALFSYDDVLYGATGDQATSTTMLWNGKSGALVQKIPSLEPVLDIVAFNSSANGSFVSTLTEQKLSIYRWE